ncbi:MAG: hypothetical protein ACXWTP_12850 [Methylosarcina sp.]
MSIHQDPILERLNPSDNFTLAMDAEIRRDGLAGSYGCFALELSNTPDMEVLQQRIAEFGRRFPVARACLRQIGRRFHWCRREVPPPLFFQYHFSGGQEEADFQQSTLCRILNHNQPVESIAPIDFHLIAGPTRQTFVIRWFHPFCDARGADLILKYLCAADDEERRQFGTSETESLVYAQLRKYRWRQQIGLLWKAKRHIERLDRLESIQPFNGHFSPLRLNYSIWKLTEEQTERVLKLAGQQVGLGGTSLYYIGCFMRALEKLSPGNAGDAYCAPYAFNLRKQRALMPLTGNHIGALFAQAPREIVSDRQALFAHLKQQNAETIRQQLDYASLPLMWAGSWLSLTKYGKTLRLSYGSGKERSSFWFSDVGRLTLPANRFPGADIDGVFYTCQVTSPPGLAFLNCIYRNRLILSYNFVEPASNAEQIGQLHRLMLAELLDEAE